MEKNKLTLAGTLDFIKGKIADSYFSGTAPDGDFYSWEIKYSLAASDTGDCTLKETTTEGNGSSQTWQFKFSDLSTEVLVNHFYYGFDVKLNGFNGKRAFAVGNGNQVPSLDIAVKDGDSANRVAKAFKYAIKLRGGKEPPF